LTRIPKYLMSFSTGGLFLAESARIAELFLRLEDWSLVKKQVHASNLLQARTQSSLNRVCREAISRLKILSNQELRFLVEANRQEQGYLLWIAVCRRYDFLGDFAIEVLRENYLTLKRDLTYEDFDSFFNRKSDLHPELDEVRPTTRKKLRQVLFKILREADLLSSDNRLIAPIFSQGMKVLMTNGNPRDILFFPVFESALKGMVQ